MAGPRKIRPGDVLSGISASGWNAFVDTTQKVNQLRGMPQGLPISQGPREQLRVMVQNKTGGALTESFSILRLTDPIAEPADLTDADGVRFRGIAFEADTPDADTGANFVVMQGPCPEDEFRPAVMLGLTWAKVDIQSDGDTHATSIDGDDTKLTSGGAGMRILWPLTGTGVKWCVVMLAPSSSESGRFYRTTGTIAAGSYASNELTLGSGNAKQLTLKTGETSIFELASNPTVTIYNSTTASIPSGKTVQCKLISGIWITDVEDCN